MPAIVKWSVFALNAAFSAVNVYISMQTDTDLPTVTAACALTSATVAVWVAGWKVPR